MVLGVIAFLLILINAYTDWLNPVKEKLGVVATPFYSVSNWPGRVGDWFEQRFQSKDRLIEENEALKAELLIVNRKLQQVFAVKAENQRLQELLNVAENTPQRDMVAEITALSPDPLTHKVRIDKGSQHGVYVGQPVVDDVGLMGRVIEVSPFSSWVLLITDSNHAMSVEVNRNGVRSVLEGVGDLYQLNLRHVANPVDIQVGDVLVSSGLDGLFPADILVAAVKTVVHDPGEPYAKVIAEPLAHLDRRRHVLLVFNDVTTGKTNDAGAVEAVSTQNMSTQDTSTPNISTQSPSNSPSAAAESPRAGEP